MKQFINIFSVDLEDWYHSYYSGHPIDTNEYRIEKPTRKILSLLKRSNNLATFFVVGEIAQKHPQLIKDIFNAGHEIACHSFHHEFIYNLSQQQFRDDSLQSKQILEKLTHKRIIGYRAPAWSADRKKTPWFWSTLKKHGFIYSSSLFPVKNFLYGDPGSPRFQHQIDNLSEIPMSTFRIANTNFGFSGGFYFRVLPLSIIKKATQSINIQNQPVIFYIHPRELDINQPRLKLPIRERFIHYHNISQTYDKLEWLLQHHQVTSFENYYKFSLLDKLTVNPS